MSERQKIYLSSPHMSDEGYEQEYVKEAFDTNWVAPLGKNVNMLEQEFTDITGTKAAAALSSGTAALHMALKAAGVGRGDIVFCPTLTFAATVNPMIYLGAEPVFIDSDYETWNMSPAALAKAFEQYPEVKAVVLVHLYGLCADLDKIMKLCRENHTPVIEDAAESLGSLYGGQWTGTFGDYGIFSFNGNKIITTSGGGMLVCSLDDTGKARERAAKVRFWSTQAREQARHYQHSEIGYNYRMSNISAGIGRGQLKVLKDRVAKKRYIYSYYKNALQKIEGVSLMPLAEHTYSNCWLTCIQLDETRTAVTPDQIMDALAGDQVESRPVWKPMHLQPVFQGRPFITVCDEPLTIVDREKWADNSVAGTLFRRGVCLPSDTKMTDHDLARVCGIIKALFAVNET